MRQPAPTKEPSRGGLFLVTVILRLGCLLLLNRWLRQLQSLGLVTPCPCWLQLALLYQTGPGVFDWANRDFGSGAFGLMYRGSHPVAGHLQKSHTNHLIVCELGKAHAVARVVFTLVVGVI